MNFFVYNMDKALFKCYHFEKKINFFIMGNNKISEFPSIENLGNGKEKEYFIVPVFLQIENIAHKSNIENIINKINTIIEKFCCELKYYKYNKENHIFFQTGDWDGSFSFLKHSIVFKYSSNDKYPLHYFTEMNIKHISCIKDARFDISFKGAMSHPIRNKINESIVNFINNGFKCFYDDKVNYWMEKNDNLKRKYKKDYINLICDSKFVLCPRGNGLNSYRFFETLECGRIPILISDDIKLPLENIIKYENFIIRVPEKDILNSFEYVKKFLHNTDLKDASEKARETWIEYFSKSSFNKFIELSLPKKHKYFI